MATRRNKLNLTVNVVSEKAQKIGKRYSDLTGNRKSKAEKTLPLNYNYFANNVIKSNKSNRMTYLIITKQVSLINEDPVLNEAAARLGQSMRETEDELIRDMLAGTASVINCTGGTNGDNPTEITRSDVDTVIATLQNNDADFVEDMIEGENKFGTGPIKDAYFGLGHTNLIGQLEAVNGFISVAQYPNPRGILPSEWGSISNVRFYLSSRGSVTTNGSLLGADIYNIFIGGQESYAKIEQNGVSAKFIYHPPGHGEDPVELRQTAAWRMAQVPRITNDAWIISLRATLA